MAALRDHGTGSSVPDWEPSLGSNKCVCTHAANDLIRKSQTTGSIVARLAPDIQTYWVTGTSAPCLSIFKPLYLGNVSWPEVGPEPTGQYDEATLWWTHERLHRRALEKYAAAVRLICPERDRMQAKFLAEERELRQRTAAADAEERANVLGAFSARCWAEAKEATFRWIDKLEALPWRRRIPWLYHWYWRGKNKAAGLKL